MRVLRHNTKITCNFWPQLQIVGRSADPASPTPCQKTGKMHGGFASVEWIKKGPSVQKPIEFITIKTENTCNVLQLLGLKGDWRVVIWSLADHEISISLLYSRILSAFEMTYIVGWGVKLYTNSTPALYHSHFFSTRSFSYVRPLT